MNRLRELLQQIDGQGYKAYKQLKGSYRFDNFQLTIDHVQGDPFALPSRISLQLAPEQHGLPERFWDSPIRRTALEDFLGRAVAIAIAEVGKGRRGSGRSGDIEIATSGQQVLRRNAVLIESRQLEARLLFALPGSGRSILGQQAIEMFCSELPQIVARALLWNDRPQQQIQQHVEQLEDQDALRSQLAALPAVAFIANGALLPASRPAIAEPIFPRPM